MFWKKKTKYKKVWGIESLHIKIPGTDSYTYYPVYQVINILIELDNNIKGKLKFEVIEYGKERLNILVEGEPETAIELKNLFCAEYGEAFSLKDSSYAIIF